ncbi:MAG TPA: peptide deformylase, partial [Acidimicrobiales bacterium]
MPAYQIRLFGDPVLTQRAAEVTDIDGSLARLVDDMVETMHEARGVGLAAPQVGVQKRLFVYQLEDREPVAVVNPTI